MTKGRLYKGGIVMGIKSLIGKTITAGAADQVIRNPNLSTNIVVAGDADLVTGNIKSGINMFGVVGKTSVVETSTGTAAAGDVLSGKVGFVNGATVTGTMPNMIGVINATGTAQWPDGSLAVYQPVGYYKGGAGDGEIKVSPAQLQVADGDLTAANIKPGISIFGIAGTFTNDAV